MAMWSAKRFCAFSMRGDAEREGGVGRGGGGVGGGIVTSYRRAHMQKLLAFTAFLMSLRGRGTFHHYHLPLMLLTAQP